MIINHGQGEVTDTDKLADVDAMLIEKCEELRQLAKSSNKQLFISVECNKTNGVFWNTIGPSTDEKLKGLQLWMDGIFKSISNGVFRLAYKNSDGEFIIEK